MLIYIKYYDFMIKKIENYNNVIKKLPIFIICFFTPLCSLIIFTSNTVGFFNLLLSILSETLFIYMVLLLCITLYHGMYLHKIIQEYTVEASIIDRSHLTHYEFESMESLFIQEMKLSKCLSYWKYAGIIGLFIIVLIVNILNYYTSDFIGFLLSFISLIYLLIMIMFFCMSTCLYVSKQKLSKLLLHIVEKDVTSCPVKQYKFNLDKKSLWICLVLLLVYMSVLFIYL